MSHKAKGLTVATVAETKKNRYRSTVIKRLARGKQFVI
jgi:hypothetical protein